MAEGKQQEITPDELSDRFEKDGLFTRTIQLKRGDFLKQAGSIDTDIYFIQSGSLRFYLIDEGEERIVRFGYAGNMMAALDSFLTGKPSDFYVQAIRKTVVKIISKVDFDRWVSAENSRQEIWKNILENLVVQQLEREKDLLVSSPKLRYERVLRRSPKLFAEVPEKYIANYLRMTPETLSRLKNLDLNQGSEK